MLAPEKYSSIDVPKFLARFLPAWISCLALFSCASTTAHREWHELSFGAWITYWDFSAGMKSVEASHAVFDDVFFFVAQLDSGGNPVLHRSVTDASLRDASSRISALGKRAWLTVVNDVAAAEANTITLKDAGVVNQILHDEEARRAHIDKLIQLTRDYAFSGLDIDYENLPASERDAFSVFAEELAAAAHASKLRLSITVQPKKREMNSIGPGAMDWLALCSATDRLQIMMYNLHSAKTPPGPMATPEWISEIQDFAATQCPSEKIVPVIKVSGMVWGPDSTRGVQYEDAAASAERQLAKIERDAPGQAPHFTFSDNDSHYTTYFEDAESLVAKLEAIARHNTASVMLWSLGRHDPELQRRVALSRTPR